MRRRSRVMVWLAVVATVGVVGSADAASPTQSPLYTLVVALHCSSAKACSADRLPNGAAFGTWLSLRLMKGGTGTYQGVDCASHLHGTTGTFSDSGHLTWTSVNSYDAVAMTNVSELEIKGVSLVHGTTSVTIVVPTATGQHDLDASQAIQVGSSSIKLQSFSGTAHVTVTE